MSDVSAISTNKRGSLPAALSFLSLADIAALMLLALLVLVFFWPAVIGRAWIPRGGGDLVSFLWPTYTFAARAFRAGHVPVWNPHLYSGAPFAADNQSGIFYPLNLLTFFWLPTLSYRAMEGLVLLHIWLAGAGMYTALRMEKAHRLAALAGATAFMFSDVFVTHVGNLNIVAVSAYLPWVFALLRRGVLRQSASWCAVAGAVLGVAALAGQAQMTLIVAAAGGLYGLWELARTRRPKLIAWLALWGGVAFGVSAIAVIPAIELTRYTSRVQLDFTEATRWSLPPAGLVGFLSPSVFGRGPSGFWGPWERVETGYAGVITLLLAGILVASRSAKPLEHEEEAGSLKPSGLRVLVQQFDGLVGFLALVIVFGAIVALGKHTPAYRLLFEYLPGFGQLRVPARYVLLPDFGLAFLAGLGLHRWMAGQIAPRRTIGWAVTLAVTGSAAMPLTYLAVTRGIPWADTPEHRQGLIRSLLIFLGLLGAAGVLLARRRPPEDRNNPWARNFSSGLTLVALLAADLILAGAYVEIEPNDPTLGFRRSKATEYLLAQPGPMRIDIATGIWQPDTAAMVGLEDIGGIHNPLALAHYDNYFWSVGHRGSPQYNFLGAQFVVADKGIPPGDSSFVPVFDEDPTVDIYLNTGAMPRATLIYYARPARDQAEAFDLVHTQDFDPAREVVIENGPTLPGAVLEGRRNIYYLTYAADRFSVVAQTPSPAYLVFSEVWYPGWQAMVDGAPVPHYRANYAFRAVFLPAGEHRVEMHFEPLAWRIGRLITFLTGTALVIWGAVASVRRQSRG